MNILVAVASKHGSTRAIAEAIGEELRRAGHTVEVREAQGTLSVEPYDAVVIGSAIYMGQWMAGAKEFVAQNRERFGGKAVWLFSSGPLGEDYPEGMGIPATLDELLAQTGAREHQVFVGRLDKSALGLRERIIARLVKAPEGDFRDWDAIRGWANRIAAALESGG